MISKRELIKRRREHNKSVVLKLPYEQWRVLPRGFLCHHPRKDVAGDVDEIHRTVTIANARDEEAFQYVMHELDDWMLRKMA